MAEQQLRGVRLQKRWRGGGRGASAWPDDYAQVACAERSRTAVGDGGRLRLPQSVGSGRAFAFTRKLK